MQPDILDDGLKRITADYGLKDRGDWLREGRCPKCAKKELYVRKDNPYILRCPRANRCGWEGATRDLYPDIFDHWGKRYHRTEAAPNAAADAYLQYRRGLSLDRLRGTFTQETYHDYDRNISSTTVRFLLPGGGHWERLIDQPSRFDKKAHFKKGSSYMGLWWHGTPSLEDLARADDIWLAEGIFNAAALQESGVAAVSNMSCNNYPEKSLADLKRECARLDLPLPRLVFAYDTGKAGHDYTLRHVERARKDKWDATAAQPVPEGDKADHDWNDLHTRDRLKPEHLVEYLWNGEVMLAENASEKALLLFMRKGWTNFHFVHGGTTFWAAYNEAKIAETMKQDGITERAAARQCGTITEIANCAFRVLYFQRDEATDDSQYYLSIDFPRSGDPLKASFKGSALAGSGDFKKRLLDVAAGAQWTGNGHMLDRITKQQFENIRTVEVINFTGYSRDHGAWLLGDLAVHKGRVVPINVEDYFDLGDRQLKLRSRDRTLDINYDAERFDVSWLPAFWKAFRENGMVTLTFWVMTLFAEQIRAEQKSLGFLEMVGIPGTGKTTIIEFLWKLLGRENYEGFDPSKSTLAGYTRNLSRVANMPVVFMEGDRGDDAPHSKRFDWSEIKGLFNGRIARATGVKNGGTETNEPPFRGALVIEQNHPVNAEPAILERIMPLVFTKDGWSETTRTAARQIEAWPIEDISGSIVHLIKAETKYLAALRKAYAPAEDALNKVAKVRNGRVRHNHAQLHAGLDALAAVIEVPADIVASTHAHINQMAQIRDRSLEADHPVVASFWETVDYLTRNEGRETPDKLNQSRKPDEVFAINLNDFEARCRKASLSPPLMEDLKKHLKTSKSRPFVEIKTVNSIEDQYVHCWVFKQPGAAASPQKGL